MKNIILVSIIVFAGLEVFTSGFILLMSAWGLFVSFSNAELTSMVLRNLASKGYPSFDSITEFQKYILFGWLYNLPAFAGSVAILRFKDWGRKLLVLTAAVTLASLLVRKFVLVQDYTFKWSWVTSVCWYIWIWFYFTCSKVRDQFKN